MSQKYLLLLTNLANQISLGKRLDVKAWKQLLLKFVEGILLRSIQRARSYFQREF